MADAYDPSGGEEGRSTLQVPGALGPTQVAVVSGNASLEVALREAMAAQVVQVNTLVNPKKVEEKFGLWCPSIVVVDAIDPVRDDNGLLIPWLGQQSREFTTVVWGHDQPWGIHFCQRLQQAKVPYVPFDRREGVQPLAEMIQSRYRSSILAPPPEAKDSDAAIHTNTLLPPQATFPDDEV